MFLAERLLKSLGLPEATQFVLATRVVDLTPHVSSSFFFARDDPALEETRWIAEHFPASNEMTVLALKAPDIASSDYRDRVEALSEAILEIPDVLSVQILPQHQQTGRLGESQGCIFELLTFGSQPHTAIDQREED